MVDQRRRLIHADPELTDHLGVPVDRANAVGRVDAELAELGDVEDRAARVLHQREVERSRRQAFEDQVRNHRAAMLEVEQVKDAAVCSAFSETMAKAADIAEQRLGVRHRLQEIAAICREGNEHIALDAVVDAMKTTRRLADARPPTPREA